MKRNPAVTLLLILLALLGVGAIFGGGVLIISPSGDLIGMPLTLLDHSPFRNFLIPGIILLFVLGLIPIGIAVALIKRPASKFAELFNFYPDMYWAWTFCIYISFALIIWIQTEMIILQAVQWLHTFYMLFAVAIIFVALLPVVRSRYKRY